MDLRTKMPQFGIVVLLISLAALVFVESLTKLLGVPSLPPRLIFFMIVSDCACICLFLFLWQILRTRKANHQANGTMNDSGTSSPLSNIAKTLSYYAIFEAIVFGILSLAIKTSPQKVWLDYLLFFMPAFVCIPLIYDARRFRDRPKAGAIRFALAMSVFCVLTLVASAYSGFLDWIVPGSISTGGLVFVGVFAALVSSVSSYWLVYKMLTQTSARPPTV